MTPGDFAQLVSMMREAQRKYFRLRRIKDREEEAREVLLRSKALERDVDKALAAMKP